jgi:hypothetical protein
LYKPVNKCLFLSPTNETEVRQSRINEVTLSFNSKYSNSYIKKIKTTCSNRFSSKLGDLNTLQQKSIAVLRLWIKKQQDSN